jgi:cytochrome b561
MFYGLRAHMSVGLPIGVLMLVRLLARIGTEKPKPVPIGSALLDQVAMTLH